MQESAAPVQSMSLQPAVRVALAAAVALALAAILGIATSASHTAVRNMSAQLQDGTRHVTLPPVEIVGRREFAMGAPASSVRSAAAATTGCQQPS